MSTDTNAERIVHNGKNGTMIIVVGHVGVGKICMEALEQRIAAIHDKPVPTIVDEFIEQMSKPLPIDILPEVKLKHQQRQSYPNPYSKKRPNKFRR